MCHYTIHKMMCAHFVLKTHDPCSRSQHQNDRFICPDNPNANAYDPRTVARTKKWTYGPGVCPQIACGKKFGLLHRHHADHDPISDRSYTSPYDLSTHSRREAERRWLAQKTPQEREYIAAMNLTADDYKRALIPAYMHHESFNVQNQRDVDLTFALHVFKATQKILPHTVPSWWAMNPRYMTAWQLYLYTSLYLDVYVAQPWVERAGPTVARQPLMVELERNQTGADQDWQQIAMWCDKVKEKGRKEEKEKETYCWGVEKRHDSVAGEMAKKPDPSGWVTQEEDR